MHWKDLFPLLKEAARDWYNHKAVQLGAALAYYGVFALAPTLVIAIAVAGSLFGEEAARGQVMEQLEQVVGPPVARAISETLTYVHVSQSGWIATLIGVVAVVLGATGLFGQLQASLNAIWGVELKPGGGVRRAVRNRLVSLLLVFGLGLLVLAALVATAVLSAVRAYVPETSLPAGLDIWQGVSWAISLGLLTLLFAMIYKLLPDVIISWRDVWAGAFVTAALFLAGNLAIGLYLGRSAVASAYGAAGSLVVVMLWVYYSSQVLLFGAEITQKFANHYGEPMRPAEYAMFATTPPAGGNPQREREPMPNRGAFGVTS